MKRSTKKLIVAFRKERLHMALSRSKRAETLARLRAEKGSKFVRNVHLEG